MAMILDAFIDRFSCLLIQLVEENVTTLLGVDNEIQNLRSTLETISIVLEDAESKRMHNKAVNRWLNKLKDVLYDADDILDLCRIEADKHFSSASRHSSKSSPSVRIHKFPRLSLSFLPFPSCFWNPSFAYKIGTRINDINLRLEQIFKEKDDYGLLHLKHNPCDEVWLTEIGDNTSSTPESDLVGSDIIDDSLKLVNLLTRKDTRENVIVFAIVGMGGIGKTTRAQLIFHHDIIKSHFQLKFWVSVSTNFNENDLLQDVISCAGGGDHSGATSRSQLETKLVDTIRGKKFFLVLDDVWVESVWDRLLRNPLSKGAIGSRVLVTTRSERVAKQMKAVYCHQVEVMSPEDGWSLLCKKLTLRGEEREIEHLKDVGLEIVEKCGGLPFAIKVIGGLLCTKSRRDWESVLRSSVWSVSGLPEQINKALYLSYLHLPSHLKQCFMYCFLLPKSLTFGRTELVQLWIAEGFIEDQGELSISMEETGERYYRELIWRNLLQSDPEKFGLAFKMHDLLRSLAGFLAHDESLLVDALAGFSNKNKSSNLRRLSIVGEEVQPDALRNNESVRTLFLFNNQWKHLNGIPSHLPFLRVLELIGSKIEVLPESVTCLLHLRYLSLCETPIKALPETIGNLKNLQFLILYKCHELDHLPHGIVDLKNLRALDIRWSPIKGIPVGIGRLRELRSLLGYTLHSVEEGEGASTTTTGKWSTLEDLGPLLQLRQLWIENLERVFDISKARAAMSTKKSHLISVILRCTSGWIDEASKVNIKRMKEVFEVLQPPSCVEVLQVKGFPGSKFPDWMMATVFSNLKLLFLFEWKYCEELPPFGQLPNLSHLHIIDFPSVSNVGREFMGACGYGGGTKEKYSIFISFPKLQNLVFDNMPRLEKWLWERDSNAMCCLQKLWLEKCPKLISLPLGLSHHATALTELKIADADSLKSVGNIDSLKKLEITDSSSLERIFNLPALKKLVIRNCPSLETVENLYSLQRVEMFDYKMNSIPIWLSKDEQLPKLVKLDIYCNQQLFGKICQQAEEEWPRLKHISHLEIYCEDDQTHTSYTKDPFSFTTTFSPGSMGMDTPTQTQCDTTHQHMKISEKLH